MSSNNIRMYTFKQKEAYYAAHGAGPAYRFIRT